MRQYSLNHVPFTPSFAVSTFVFNPRQNDERPSVERLERPVMLDCGLSEATVPDLTLKTDSSVHFVISNNRFMNAGTKQVRVMLSLGASYLCLRQDFEYGQTEVLDLSVIGSRLHGFFRERSTQPMVLLVHDRVPSLNVLRNCGIDTSTWEVGITGLLGFKSKVCLFYYQVHMRTLVYNDLVQSDPEPSRRPLNDPRMLANNSGRPSQDEYARRRDRPRPRSRSPRRSGDDTSASRSSSSYDRHDRRGSSPDHVQRSAPVYVVDVKQLYVSLMQTEVASENVAKISERLELSANLGWCAGNEAA